MFLVDFGMCIFEVVGECMFDIVGVECFVELCL